ncbi:MAG: hypothetical protein PHV07_08725 [Oscillospiraceae bacterium]|nr:hypothetical protein [Oscillospiraceae bacterium]
MCDKASNKKPAININEFNSKAVIDNSLIEEEEKSIELTGSTAASDINYYFDQLKQQNNE